MFHTTNQHGHGPATLPPPGPEAFGSLVDGGFVESSATLDTPDLESLFFALDASLGVHARPQFFSWTQGLLQSLLPHDVLMCALRNGEPHSFRVEVLTALPAETGALAKSFLRDASLLPALVKAWEAGQYRPLVLDLGGQSPFADTPFARDLEQAGATQVVVHGTHDASGHAVSLFAFAGRPGAKPRMAAYLAQCVVPFVHTAWVRTHVTGGPAPKAQQSTHANPLTMREREILSWIYLGKSNFEIGAILTISPLTVKNHVRKILRKLDVVNRTQAIGKALELRILNV